LRPHARPDSSRDRRASQAQNERCRVRNGGVDPLALQTSERGLLELLVAQLGQLDPDLIVGHNIGSWDISILLQRMQHHKVLNWSRMGRFRRSRMPNLTGGGHMYGGGASQVRPAKRMAAALCEAASASLCLRPATSLAAVVRTEQRLFVCTCSSHRTMRGQCAGLPRCRAS
jgi:DNA polymerase family B, exonuclease domain